MEIIVVIGVLFCFTMVLLWKVFQRGNRLFKERMDAEIREMKRRNAYMNSCFEILTDEYEQLDMHADVLANEPIFRDLKELLREFPKAISIIGSPKFDLDQKEVAYAEIDPKIREVKKKLLEYYMKSYLAAQQME